MFRGDEHQHNFRTLNQTDDYFPLRANDGRANNFKVIFNIGQENPKKNLILEPGAARMQASVPSLSSFHLVAPVL